MAACRAGLPSAPADVAASPVHCGRYLPQKLQRSRCSCPGTARTSPGPVPAAWPRNTTSDGVGIPGGVGGGTGYDGHVIFYVGVPDVEAALQKAESLGGTRRMGPAQAPTGLVVGHFTDPEGHLIGVAGPA